MVTKNEISDPQLEKEVQRQLKELKFGVVEITPENEFVEMLRASIRDNRPLRVKCGIDPTNRDVHIGHSVPYRKMRQFQDLGHIGVVIIGDYTASIGDPTGRNDARPPLGPDEIKENAMHYMEQVYTIVDKDKTEIVHQSEWFRETSLSDVISWASQTTVAKLLSHETFKERLDNTHPLFLHELFYPMLQGIDSVFVKADVELGATDQKFNVLMGRDYQRHSHLRPQVAMLMPLLTGLCGTQKMSKSLNNYIGILDEPFDKFGKVMSIPDSMMLEYFEYVGNVSPEELASIKKGYEKGDLHPNELKKQLAGRIVSFFHGADVANSMREKFENVFKNKGVPEDAPQYEITGEDSLVSVIFESGLLQSKGEVRRLVKQNAITVVDGEKISDSEVILDKTFKGKTLKIGKRKFLKLT